MPSDEELLEAWAAGDLRAADILVDRYFEPLFRFVRSAAPDAAEDLVQTTLEACVEHRGRLREQTSFRPFLFGIARNVILMHWRTRMRCPSTVDVAELSLAELDASPSEHLGRRRQERLLLHALRRLKLDDQILVQLRFWEGLSAPILASMYAVPETTIWGRLRRACDRLRTEMERASHDPAWVRSTMEQLDQWANALSPGHKLRFARTE